MGEARFFCEFGKKHDFSASSEKKTHTHTHTHFETD